MRDRRRLTVVNPQLESMESRDVPSAISLKVWARTHPNAFARARAQVQHARSAHLAELRRAAALHAVARPATAPRMVVPSAHSAMALASIHPPTVSSMVSRPTPTPTLTTAATVTPASRPLNVIMSTNMSNSNNHPTAAATTSATTTNTNISDVKNGPLAKAGPNLIALYTDYQSYESGGGHGTFTSSQSATLEIVGTQVRVDVRGSGDTESLASTLSSMGMQVSATDANSRTVEGLLPISQLPNVAQLSQVSSVSPVFRPRLA